MADLTAIVLTRNEQANIGACIDSVRGFAKRVAVIDCGSTDETVNIALEKGAEVFTHDFTYYAAQFNWAIDNIGVDTRWTLRLDADERFTPAVCAQCEQIMRAHEEDDVNGIVIEADFYFLGRQMKHGLTNKRKIMVFKTGVGRIEDRKRDAHTVLSHGRTVAIRERFLHYDFKDLNSYISRYNWYTIRELQDYLAYEAGGGYDVNTDQKLKKHRKHKFTVYYRAPMFLRAWLWFMYNYYLKLGFLDGREGYIYNYLECYWYRFLVDAKIYEHRITGGAPEELGALKG